MVKIDIDQFTKDRIWFGWRWLFPLNHFPIDHKGNWAYIPMWRFRLWPCMLEDSDLPKWWVDIFCKFSKDGQ